MTPSASQGRHGWTDVLGLEGTGVSEVYLVSDAYQGGHTDTITHLQFNNTEYLG